ncbi:uncharacterized protein PV07_05190 [Cladophialophora immunda]|uniref:Uncharacterized protein n=1 Tax=Cladophialophora immunda TaxID=569365 RepID=A0A0D2AVR8_9EURO|nr:uncharacterized protein PV07_05190 [Cladophialophora immunda]KIW29372.1 hypothetical protein PV07_05190 [Cladophialophora immunda]OQV06534.1 hypothetical protein CLAIMM_11086 [Cladophialophora immunda]
MAPAMSRPDLLLLEADFLQAQSEIVQRLSSDIHFAAKILDFKVYDIESRIAGLRKAAWEKRSKHSCEGDALVDGQKNQVGYRHKGILENATTLIETAQQVKTELKALTEVVCGIQEVVQAGTASQEWTEEGNAGIEAANVKGPNVHLPPLEATLTEELHGARQVFVESSTFIPVNFRAVASKFSSTETAESLKIYRPKHVKGAPFAGEDTMVAGGFVSAANHAHRRPHDRAEPRGRRAMRFSHVELPGRSDRDHRSRSPAGCRKAGKQEEGGDLLGWIPKKVGIARLPMDDGLRALMMQDMKKGRRDRAC